MAWNVALVLNPSIANLLGANAFDPVGYSSGPVWLNELKQAASNAEFCPWFTGSSGTFDTGEEAYLVSTLDSNYFPTTLTVAGIPGGQQFTKLFTYIFQNMPALGPNQTYQYTPGARTLGFTILGSGSAATIQFQITGDVSGLATTTSGVSVSGNTVTSTLAPGQSGTVTFNANGGLTGFVITIPAGSGISPSCYFGFNYLVRTSLLSSYNAGEIICPEYKAALQAGWNAPIRFMGAQHTFDQDWKLTFTGTVSGTSGGTISSIAGHSESHTTWPFPTGTWPVVFATGQVINCNFTYGSNAVTWSTALSSSVTTSAIAAMAMVPVHQRTWADRALLSHMSWALYKGLPLEALAIACNELNLPPWINIPGTTNFTDTTWSTNLANLMHDGTGANITGSNQASFGGLNSNLLARIEYTNECWGTYLSTNLVEMMSVPSGFYAAQGNNQFYGGQEWYGTQIAGICDAFSGVYGGSFSSRVRVVCMDQFATGNGTGFMEVAMNTPDWTSRAYTHGIGAYGFAPYWGTDSISAADAATIKALADPVGEIFSLLYTNHGASGNTYSSIPTAGLIGSTINTASSIISAFSAQPWKSLPIECYEGGSGLDDANGIESSVSGWRVNVLDAVQTDARFQYTYYDPTHQLSSNNGYLPMLQALGISFMCQLSMVGNAMTASTPNGGGNWGTVVSVMQTLSPLSSAPSKFQGCIKFASGA